MDKKSISHLVGRCGTCEYWTTMLIGQGSCSLVEKDALSPIRLSDGGALYTRIDFGCRWYIMSIEAKLIMEPVKPEPKKDQYGRVIG